MGGDGFAHYPNLSVGCKAVLRRVALGMKNRQIAGELVESEAAVRMTLCRFYQRTGMHGRSGAIAWALRHERCCLADSRSADGPRSEPRLPEM